MSSTNSVSEREVSTKKRSSKIVSTKESDNVFDIIKHDLWLTVSKTMSYMKHCILLDLSKINKCAKHLWYSAWLHGRPIDKRAVEVEVVAQESVQKGNETT